MRLKFTYPPGVPVQGPPVHPPSGGPGLGAPNTPAHPRPEDLEGAGVKAAICFSPRSVPELYVIFLKCKDYRRVEAINNCLIVKKR